MLAQWLTMCPSRDVGKNAGKEMGMGCQLGTRGGADLEAPEGKGNHF